MIDKRVGKRIKQRREQLGLTQEQFAEKLGVATKPPLTQFSAMWSRTL